MHQLVDCRTIGLLLQAMRLLLLAVLLLMTRVVNIRALLGAILVLRVTVILLELLWGTVILTVLRLPAILLLLLLRATIF